MFEDMFAGFRKASESSLQMQQDLFRQFTQQWMSAPAASTAGASTDWMRGFQKRWIEMAVEMLGKHRESLDSMYGAGIQVIEQAFRTTEAKSSDDYRRMVEEIWRKLFDTFRDRAETQFREFQKWAEQSFDKSRKT